MVTFRLTNGLVFDLPAGWRFSALTGKGVVLHRQRADDKATFDKANPNTFALSETTSASADGVRAGWVRLDRQGNRTLPNGAKVEWYIGSRYVEGHYGIGVRIEAQYRTLAAEKLIAPTPELSPEAIEQAVLAIAGSMRIADQSAAFFHPVGLRTVQPGTMWGEASVEEGIILHCRYCGKNSALSLYAYPATNAVKTGFASDEMALKFVTDNFQKQGLKGIGKTRQLDLDDGVLLWTEQPDTTHPFLGVIRKNGVYFFAFLLGSATSRALLEELRPHYLHIAAGLRPWDGK